MEFGRYYHIYNHAIGKENLFREPENYRWFLEQYYTYISPIAETYAYCLLPNHFHFLVRLRDPNIVKRTFPTLNTVEKLAASSLPSKQFSRLFSSYTQAFNKRHKRKGSLFMKNFKRRPIDSDQYFSLLTAYIHMNPVLHGFAHSPVDWKWSSYQSVIGSAPTRIERKRLLDWFGNRDELISFHEQYQASKFPEIEVLDWWFKLN
jgi:REP element-mobilizing transposase RayT